MPLDLYPRHRRHHIDRMAVLEIIRMGHPLLQGRAREVADPTDPALLALVADMHETMEAAHGIGLAAPQVAVPLRLVIFSVPAARTADGVGVPPTVLVNPELIPLSPATEDGYEGCLSLPGLTGVVPRWSHLAYRGVGLDGRPIEREAHGFHARVVQHECDHLDGILYPMRMRDAATLAYVEELRRKSPETVVEED